MKNAPPALAVAGTLVNTRTAHTPYLLVFVSTILWRKEMADETTELETTDERNIEHSDDTTPDEAHRIGEFDDIRDRLANLAEVSNKILEGLETVRSSMAAFVEGGATIREDGDDSVDEVTEESEDDLELEVPIEELDFDLD